MNQVSFFYQITVLIFFTVFRQKEGKKDLSLPSTGTSPALHSIQVGIRLKGTIHKLNIEVDLQSLFVLHVT